MKPIIGISGSIIIDDGGIFLGYRRSYVNDDYIDSVIQNLKIKKNCELKIWPTNL